MKAGCVIMGLQFGSEGKGLLAGYLAKKFKPDTIVTAWAPNAGHTFVDALGNKYVSIALPSGLVSDSVKRVLLGPGSCIDPDLLLSEMGALDRLSDGGVELYIHEHAAIVDDEHRHLVSQYAYRVGGVMKGGGEALMEKMRRATGDLGNIARLRLQRTLLEGSVVSVEEYNDLIDRANFIQVEAAQGFGLGINNGIYPYCTWRDCSVHQILSDCAIPINFDFMVYGVARTLPIRVANRFKDGKQVGWSGPGYWDQEEIEWSSIGVEPELTTVSKLPRRLFSFSEEQIRQAIRMNGVDQVFLNFCNYVPRNETLRLCAIINKYAHVGRTGWGPREDHIEEI